MAGNSGSTRVGYSGGVAINDPKMQMLAYDLLPVTVRRAYDAQPLALCCLATLGFYREYGAAVTIDVIRRSGREYIGGPVPEFRRSKRRRRELNVRACPPVPEYQHASPRHETGVFVRRR